MARKTDPHPETDPEARLAVLDAVARTPAFFDAYVLKGGLALHLAYGSPRRSHDLDFNAVAAYPRAVDEATSHTLIHAAHALERALAEVASAHGFAGMAVQLKQLSDEIPVLLTQVGYGLTSDETPPYRRAVEMQITLCEPVCATTTARVGALRLHVPTLEDILSEKLKALAQQVERHNGSSRASDVFDLWYFATQSPNQPDSATLRDCLLEKAADLGGLPLQAETFRHPRVRASGEDGYAELQANLPAPLTLPPFDDAFAAVLALVDALDLPAPAAAD